MPCPSRSSRLLMQFLITQFSLLSVYLSLIRTSYVRLEASLMQLLCQCMTDGRTPKYACLKLLFSSVVVCRRIHCDCVVPRNSLLWAACLLTAAWWGCNLRYFRHFIRPLRKCFAGSSEESRYAIKKFSLDCGNRRFITALWCDYTSKIICSIRGWLHYMYGPYRHPI